MTNPARVPLEGADSVIPQGWTKVGPSDPATLIRVTLKLPRSAALPPVPIVAAGAPGQPKRPTREQFSQAHGSTDPDIARVETFALAAGLTVLEVCRARRSVWVTGTIAQFEAAFGVVLERYRDPQGNEYRLRSGPIMIPADLEGVILGVFGLDNRPQARSHFRLRAPLAGAAPHAQGGNSQFSPTTIASLYDFPTNLDGTGETIAIIELGGGFSSSDLQAYFSQLGLPVPTVTGISVDGSSNSPTGSPNGPDGEVALDIEIAGAIAPKAKIVVYFAPNTDAGFLDAVSQAVHDAVNKPSVISISWGGPESNWAGQAVSQFNMAFQDAEAMGVTVCVAAGDSGSSDGVQDGLAHVDFPASSPNVLACGGTELFASNSAIMGEVVWNEPSGGATGGGVSDLFPLPSYQSAVGVPPSANPGGRIGRGVPDVAANADPNTGYVVLIDGQSTVAGGTSAVAPLWAGLVALLNQALGRPVGFLNPTIYQSSVSGSAFRDITSGNNGAYSAGPGWDACSGLGVAIGAKLLKALGG